jgi:cell division protein FtsI/penicillin-binding protein 2
LLVLVMIEGGQHGGTVAAPVARQLIDFAYPRTR